MDICFIGAFPLPNNSPSNGPETVLYNLVTRISDVDTTINIKIISVHDKIKHDIIYKYSHNVCVYYFKKLKFISRSWGDPIIVKNFMEKHSFDIIHAHYPIALSRIMGLDTPKILTLHGIFHIEQKFVADPFVLLFYYKYNIYMLKKIFPKLDGFVAISPYVVDIIHEMGLYYKIKKIYHINNPIDKLFFSVKPRIETNNLIFYPSNISKSKNQIAAINAVKLIKKEIDEFKLVLAGNAEASYLKTIINEVRLNNLAKNVDYRGILSRTEILETYRKSSIVYLFSKQEVQPMVILEAMAIGIPVIASNIKSIQYLVKHGVTGYLVDPNDSKAIAKYTIDLLWDNKKRSIMGQNAKKIVEDLYHVDCIVKQTLNMYHTILDDEF